MVSNLSSALPGLPVEPNSRSEILAANHVFTVEITTFTATPWEPQGFLEHRTIEMSGTVIENLKGELARHRFGFKVEQQRDDPYTAMAYYGLWSHISVAAGQRFLVVANSASDDPAHMMNEPECRALLDVSRRADVIAAIDGERAWNLVRPEQGEVAKVRALLLSSAPRRAEVEDVFGRYLGARVEPVLGRDAKDLEPDVLTWISTPDANPKLVLATITAVDNVLVRLGRPAELVRPFAQKLAELAANDRLVAIRRQLLETFLLNSVMPEEGSHLRVQDAFPDPTDRKRLADLLSPMKSEQAIELQKWLKQH
jgi:hypothetical protein